jgi:hypothetical protein
MKGKVEKTFSKLVNQSTPKDIPGRQTAGDILMKILLILLRL